VCQRESIDCLSYLRKGDREAIEQIRQPDCEFLWYVGGPWRGALDAPGVQDVDCDAATLRDDFAEEVHSYDLPASSVLQKMVSAEQRRFNRRLARLKWLLVASLYEVSSGRRMKHVSLVTVAAVPDESAAGHAVVDRRVLVRGLCVCRYQKMIMVYLLSGETKGTSAAPLHD
jgi:hypothetical protein